MGKKVAQPKDKRQPRMASRSNSAGVPAASESQEAAAAWVQNKLNPQNKIKPDPWWTLHRLTVGALALPAMLDAERNKLSGFAERLDNMAEAIDGLRDAAGRMIDRSQSVPLSQEEWAASSERYSGTYALYVERIRSPAWGDRKEPAPDDLAAELLAMVTAYDKACALVQTAREEASRGPATDGVALRLERKSPPRKKTSDPKPRGQRVRFATRPAFLRACGQWNGKLPAMPTFWARLAIAVGVDAVPVDVRRWKTALDDWGELLRGSVTDKPRFPGDS